jgi:hypothetical protein
VTADVKYDVFLEAKELGINLLDAGHFATENVVTEPLAQSLKQAMAAYDLDLMRQSFSLLGQALDGGQLTWHEYFVELEALIRQGQSYLKLENRYQKLLAELFADSL